MTRADINFSNESKQFGFAELLLFWKEPKLMCENESLSLGE
jgi:hypothetical protein